MVARDQPSEKVVDLNLQAIEKGNTNSIENRPPNQSFYLEDMGVIYEQAGGKADEPHRHEYYTVLLVEQAEGTHIVDFMDFPFRHQEVHFVSPGQVHQVVVRRRPRGWVFTFSRDFLAENNIPESFISNLNLFRTFGQTPPLSMEEATFQKLRSLVQEMQSCSPESFVYRNRALGALLQLFLIYCNNHAQIDKNQLNEGQAGVCLLRDFKDLVEQHFQDWRKVGQYAAEVKRTPKHLSETVKQLTGKTAKEVIQDRLLLEAKRLLLHTDLSIKEIAFQIGFEEPLHFSAFFKRQVGVPASDFRKA